MTSTPGILDCPHCGGAVDFRFHCLRCAHIWFPRDGRPPVCCQAPAMQKGKVFAGRR